MEKIEEIYYHKCRNGTEAHIVLKRDPKTGKWYSKSAVILFMGNTHSKNGRI